MKKNDHPERNVEKTARDIRRATRRDYSAEEKIRIGWKAFEAKRYKSSDLPA